TVVMVASDVQASFDCIISSLRSGYSTSGKPSISLDININNNLRDDWGGSFVVGRLQEPPTITV
ncbi:MAG: hypothetical protein KDC43_26795, partial [Saprospiraceae bacterium]|nr:hypothetical protein [Saprospiraceae bacterium]